MKVPRPHELLDFRGKCVLVTGAGSGLGNGVALRFAEAGASVAVIAAARPGRRRWWRKWRKLCPAVATSLEEAGEELLTFYGFPASQHKSLRTTNAIERLQQEFRRRVKTQASLPSEKAVLLLFFALFAGGQMRLHRIAGWNELVHLRKEAA